MPLPLPRTPEEELGSGFDRPAFASTAGRGEITNSAPPFLIAVPPLPESMPFGDRRIPDPDPAFIRALAVQGYEVVEGTRSLSQLGSLITVGAARSLTMQRTSYGDRRIVYRDARQQRPLATTVRVDRPCDEIAEAAVVLRTRERSHAVALRLEWSHQHWRASELVVL